MILRMVMFSRQTSKKVWADILSLSDITFMPISAQTSIGIKDRIPKKLAPWYDGPSLLEYLDEMKALERKVNAPFMMPVNGKYRVSAFPTIPHLPLPILTTRPFKTRTWAPSSKEKLNLESLKRGQRIS